MARLEIIAGNYGTGRGDWINFEFHLPKKQRLAIEQIASVEENGEHLERSVLGFLKGGASGALGIGSAAAIVGIFAAPLAAVGAIGLTAAAIGGGIGAFGGSVERKVLMQVLGADGRGFIAICEKDVPGEVRKAVSVAHALRMRQREAEAAVQAAKPRLTGIWERRPKAAAPVVTAVVPAAALALPEPAEVPALDMQAGEDGIFTVAGNAIAATAESAGSIASDAYDATSEAIEGAWTAVRNRLPWPGGGR